MKPRRLQRATISSIETSSGRASAAVCSMREPYRPLRYCPAGSDAHLRVQMHQRPPLRGDPEDGRRPARGLPRMRSPGRARLPPGGSAFQGIGLLHDGLRGEEEERERRRRVEGRVEGSEGTEDFRLEEIGLGQQNGDELRVERQTSAVATRRRYAE